MGGGGGFVVVVVVVVSHPLQLTTGLVVNSFIITNPTLAGERMLLIPKVSILSEQMLFSYLLTISLHSQPLSHRPPLNPSGRI